MIVSIEDKFFDTEKAIFNLLLTEKTGNLQHPKTGEIYLSSDNIWYLRKPDMNNKGEWKLTTQSEILSEYLSCISPEDTIKIANAAKIETA
jgi:hypothetical protein